MVGSPEKIREDLRRKLQERGYVGADKSATTKWQTVSLVSKTDYGDSGGGLTSADTFRFHNFTDSDATSIGVLRSDDHACHTKAVVAPWGDQLDTMISSGGELLLIDSLSAFWRAAWLENVYMRMGRVPKEPIQQWLKKVNLTDSSKWPVEWICRAMGLTVGRLPMPFGRRDTF